jgi:Sporulation and spore germination/Immunoglobulin-like domain of bacterial spore germination
MRRIAVSLAVLAAGLAAGGCGGTTSSAPRTEPQTQTAPPSSTSVATTTTAAPASQLTLRVYLLRDGRVTPVARTVPQTPAVARAALEQLLAGPTAAERANGLTTDVPAGASLRGVTIADGRATVDLDPSFAQGAEATISPRLAQLVFTLTQFPSVHSVAFEAGGKPLPGVTNGNGALLDHPPTRADYEQLTPLILVESPLPGETVTSPLHVRGSANVFEATFQLEVQDTSGAVLWKHFVTASSGAPERGTFDVSIPLHAAPGPIRVVAYDENQANGQRENEVVVPVTLAS